MQRLLAFFTRPHVLWSLIVINGLGTVGGFLWYKGQLMATPLIYWPLIPDSPQASADLTLFLLLLALGRTWGSLGLLACFQLVKYGLWAVLMNLHAGWLTGRFTAENLMLTVSHLGMAVEGLIFLGLLRLSLRGWFLLTAWLFFNDWADYTWGIYPYLFDPAQYPVAWMGVVALSVLLSLLGLWKVRRSRKIFYP